MKAIAPPCHGTRKGHSRAPLSLGAERRLRRGAAAGRDLDARQRLRSPVVGPTSRELVTFRHMPKHATAMRAGLADSHSVPYGQTATTTL